MSADLVFTNANVITMDSGQPGAQLVATRGDRILMVGTSRDLDSVRGPATRVIDCQGKTIVPGFNDAHCHVFSMIRKQLSVDLSPASVSSITDIKAAISRRLQSLPTTKWVIGTDYNEFYLDEKRHPTRWDLDDIASANPVLLIHRSRHACVLNSTALALAGIHRETEEPPDGLIDRDISTGEPNGILFGMVGHTTRHIQPTLSEEELDEGAAQANQYYLSRGITSFQDASVSNDLKRWKTLRRFKDTSRLRSRISMMVGIESLNEFHEAGFHSGYGDEHLRLGGTKIMLSEVTGRLHPSPDELNAQVAMASVAGFQVNIHAIEQNCVEAAVAALEHIQHLHPGTPYRHRIEHCSECPPDLLNRLVKLRPVIVTQPSFIYYNGDRYLATIPGNQLAWLYPLRSLLDAGLLVAGSSDSPVVDASPLVGIHAAANRQSDKGDPLQSEERVSPYDALTMYTKNSAYACFEEKAIGSITPGKLADMVLLGSNPLSSPLEQLKDIRVEMTVIGGEIVWES
jgi:predicted amidohydrolase YtcJ